MGVDSACLASSKVPAMRWLAIILGLVGLSLAGAAVVSLLGHMDGIYTGDVEPVRLLPGVISKSFRGYQPYLVRATQLSPAPNWFMAIPFLFYGGISTFFAIVAELLSTVSAARARRQAKAKAATSAEYIVPGRHSQAHFRYWPIACPVAAAATALNFLLLVKHLSPPWETPPLSIQIAFVVQVLVSIIVVGRAAA